MIFVRSNPTIINPTAEMFTFGDMEIEMVFRQNIMGGLTPLLSFGGTTYASSLYDNLYAISVKSAPSSSAIVASIEVGNEYSGANQNYFSDSMDLIKLNTWHRVRVVRKGANYKTFVDGTQVLDVSFPERCLPQSFINPPVNGKQVLQIGGAYYGVYGYQTSNYSVDVMYIQIKNETGKVVYGMGSDPGSSPGVPSPMVFKGKMEFDPYGVVQPRVASKSKGSPIESAMYAKPRSTGTTAKGMIFDEKEISGIRIPLPKLGILDYDPVKIVGKVKPRRGVIQDPFYKTFVRGSQRGNAYILDMTGSGGGGDGPGEINAPRAFPLESPWKKANPTNFSK